MFSQGVVQTPYMSYDFSVLNPYNYKSLNSNFENYQHEQNLYYSTRQINPISIVNTSPQNRDPSNLPCDVRTNIYFQGDANNNELLNIHRTPANNPNLWRDQLPAEHNYYRTTEYNPNNIRQLSHVQKGHESSIIDYHGYYL